MNRAFEIVRNHKTTVVLSALVFLVGVFVVMVLAGRGPDPRIESIRKQGYPTNLEQLDAFYASVPPDLNPAAAYCRAFDLLKGDQEDFSEKRWMPPHGQRLTAEDKAELAELLAERADAMEELHNARVSPHSRYPVDLKQGFAVPLPHLAQMKKAASMLSAEALLHSENGESDKAVQSLLAASRVGNSASEEPILISELVRVACWSIVLSRLERVLELGAPSQAQLAAMQQAVAEAEKPKGLARALAGERAMGISAFDDPKRHFMGLSGGQSSGSDSERFRITALVCLLKTTGFWKKDRVFYLDQMENMIAVAEQPYPQRFTNGQQAARNLPPSKFYLFSQMLLPGLSKASLRSDQLAARIRVAQTALAIERYRSDHAGALPKDLKDLTPSYLTAIPLDPFNGEPLRFLKRETGYAVYSVGSDAEDDGAAPEDPKKRSETPQDIAFMVER